MLGEEKLHHRAIAHRERATPTGGRGAENLKTSDLKDQQNSELCCGYRHGSGIKVLLPVVIKKFYFARINMRHAPFYALLIPAVNGLFARHHIAITRRGALIPAAATGRALESTPPALFNLGSDADSVKVTPFREPYADKIEGLLAMFGSAGLGGVQSPLNLAVASPGADSGTAAAPGNSLDGAMAGLRSYDERFVQCNLADPAIAFADAQTRGAAAVTAERVALRAAVVALVTASTLPHRPPSVQLGVMCGTADLGYAALRNEWLPALGLPVPREAALNLPALVRDTPSFLLYDSAPPVATEGDGSGGGGAAIALRRFEGSGRGVLFMPRFSGVGGVAGGDMEVGSESESESESREWSMAFGELPLRLFANFGPPPLS